MQPDTIIPDLSNPQSWNRYSYVQNNPIGYNDPTGHKRINELDGTSRRGCSDPKFCYKGKPKPVGPIITHNPNPIQNKPAKNGNGTSNLGKALTVGSALPDYLAAQQGSVYMNAKGNTSLTASPLFTEQYGLVSNGNYNPSTISRAVSQNLLRGAGSWSAFGLSGLSALTTNMFDYTFGEHAGEEMVSQEFAVSVGVDTVFGVAAGMAAATMVTAAVTAGVIVAAPVAIVALTVATTIAVGMVVSGSGATDMIKSDVNWAIDSMQGEY